MTADAHDQRRDSRRRFEQWAKNPTCGANTISAILGVPMREVAQKEGDPGTYGQSAFALARGQSFEAGLLRDGAERLIVALQEAGVLPDGAGGLLDIRQRRQGGPMRDLDQAIEATRQHLITSAASDVASRPREAVIAGAAFRVPGEMMLPEAVLVVDALVVIRHEDPPQLIVGEVKTYPDRGGYTDSEQLATARAQAGVYAHGLELTLEEVGITGRLTVSDKGFLVLSRPGSNMPSIRPHEELHYQIERARRGFAQLRSLARQLGRPSGNGLDIVQEGPTSYGETCVSFCERASICRARAFASGDPAALGQEMAHWLGEVTLHRALELLDGRQPETVAEQDLVGRLQDVGMLP